jgi:oligoribonuclease NrnB/cAMP/cGMP phosphodiesterase (DHH superfamily)
MQNSKLIDFSKLYLKPRDIDIVIYHGDCIDGYASAFACYYYHKVNKTKKRITYIPGMYQKSPPLVSGKNVLICDFSYKNKTLKDMINESNKLIILDHHKSAEKDLRDIDQKHKIFDVKHSGAYITWAYFFGEKDIPSMIKYIQDNDIFKREFNATKAFTSFIFNVPKTFDSYEKFLDEDYINKTVIPVGEGMSKQNESYINEGVKKAAIHFLFIDSKLYFVASVNTSVMKSEIGNQLFNVYENINFSICYSKNSYTGETYLSLRSIDKATDVEEIASKFGGGGHRNAAGLSVFNSDTIPSILIDRYQCYNLIQNISIKSEHIKDLDLDINVVYLNSPFHKRHIGKYLLQTRYEENYNSDTRKISEACSIIRNIKRDLCYYVSLDLACIYYYSNSENFTYFSLVSDNLDLLLMLKDHYTDYVFNTDDNNISNRLKLKIPGLLSKFV